MIDRIFLDLDDTLNEFTPDALKALGCDCQTYADYPAHCGYNIMAAAAYYGLHAEKKTFWDSIPRSVWAKSTKSEECDWLVEMCAKAVGKKSVFIATSPTKDPDCLAGKLEWIVNNLPEWIHRQYVITPRKWLLAGPTALLIDDSVEKLEEFNAHNGVTICFPRPWNWRYGCDIQDHLAKRLGAIFPFL